MERNYKERQRERVRCPECRKYLTRGSLATHFQTYNGVAKEVTAQEREGGGGGKDTRTYRILFLTRAGLRHCLVEGCSGQAVKRTAMRVHFWNRYVRDTNMILE